MNELTTSPCRDCRERSPRCHAICEDYKQWAEWQREIKAAERSANTAGYGSVKSRYLKNRIKRRVCRRFGTKGRSE